MSPRDEAQSHEPIRKQQLVASRQAQTCKYSAMGFASEARNDGIQEHHITGDSTSVIKKFGGTVAAVNSEAMLRLSESLEMKVWKISYVSFDNRF